MCSSEGAVGSCHGSASVGHSAYTWCNSFIFPTKGVVNGGTSVSGANVCGWVVCDGKRFVVYGPENRDTMRKQEKYGRVETT